MRFIVAEGNAYALTYDKYNGTHQIVDPSRTTRPPYPVRLNKETGRWQINTDHGLKGGGDHEATRQRLRSELERLQAQRERTKMEYQQTEQDLRHVETGIVGYRMRGLNAPSEMEALQRQRQQRLQQLQSDLWSLNDTITYTHQEMERLPRGS